ncbi:hypothetical protein GQL56_09930 [Pseudomonas putida]|nr:hypothetical protein [Pseudomonas putida]
MPAGLQVINDNGILQVDESFKNMVLTQKGTVTLSRPSGVGAVPYQAAAYATIAYPVSARQPVLALRSNALVCYLANDNGFTVFGSASGAIDYYIFDQIGFGTSAGNIGLQVFDANGSEVFNSNNKYMKVLDLYSVELVVSNPGNPPTVPTYSGSVPSGKKLAVCMGVQSTGYYIEGIGTPQQPAVMIRYWHCQCITPTDNTYTLSNSVINIFGGPMLAQPGLSGSISPFSSGMILDVTGF